MVPLWMETFSFELGRYYVHRPDFFRKRKLRRLTSLIILMNQFYHTGPSDLRVIRVKSYQGNMRHSVKAKDLNDNLGSAVARGYYKLIAYKDEYEVARLHTEYLENQVKNRFSGYKQLRFNLALHCFLRGTRMDIL